MNFTISSILIVFFLIPGFIFRRAYYSSPFSRKYSKFSLLGEISWIIIPSLILHILGIYLLYWFWYIKFLDLQQLFSFILDSYSDKPLEIGKLNFHIIVIYTGVLWLSSFVAGYLLNLVIRRSHLDKRWPIFSFDNEWYYYLSGEILDYPNIVGTSQEVGLTFVDVLTKTGEETVLYSGICQKFDLKEDGGLASICLTNVQRKGFLNPNAENINSNELAPYKEFPSTFLVIPFESIINLNVRFFKAVIKAQPIVTIPQNANGQSEAEEKKASDLNINLSDAQLVILVLSFLMILVAVLSFVSKPDKPKREKELDAWSSIVSLVLLISILLCRFALDISWKYTLIGNLGVFILVSVIFALWKKRGGNKSDDDKK